MCNQKINKINGEILFCEKGIRVKVLHKKSIYKTQFYSWQQLKVEGLLFYTDTFDIAFFSFGQQGLIQLNSSTFMVSWRTIAYFKSVQSYYYKKVNRSIVFYT